MIYDVENDIYKWEKPSGWFNYSINKDTAYRITSDTTDQLVSRNHRCLVEREGKLVFIQAEHLNNMEVMPTLSNDFYLLSQTEPEVLQQRMQWSVSWRRMEETRTQRQKSLVAAEQGQFSAANDGGFQSILEGRDNLSFKERLLQSSKIEVSSLSRAIQTDGEERRICSGISFSDGDADKSSLDERGMCASYRSQSDEQSNRQFDAICNEQGSQEIRSGSSYSTTMATITSVEYSGVVFCPTVSTGAFIARRNDKVFITGNSGFPKNLNVEKTIKEKHPDKYDEEKHSGLGTALKPAHEPICVARKPLEGTIAQNVLEHGTGALNIDASRVGEGGKKWVTPRGGIWATDTEAKAELVDNPLGRWPANLIHDGSIETEWSKFFYGAKASPKDRNAGLENFEGGKTNDGRKVDADNAYQRGASIRKNTHPTVKPTDLMRYLVKMVTPPGGTTLDPFMGSGSTGRGAMLEGFNFIGIEMTDEYIPIATARIEDAKKEYEKKNNVAFNKLFEEEE
jgi:site-specific DNA-methyltransferase (adenine-specific)